MKIGILQCDTVLEQWREPHGDFPAMHRRLLHSVNPEIETEVFDIRQGHFPSSIDAVDAYLITGSRHGVYDELPWIGPLKRFIIQLHAARKRTVGICFGHQVIAEALGGRAAKSAAGWGVGVHTMTLFAHPSWMQPKLPKFSLLVSHQDQVLEPPPNSKVLGGSDFCPYAALQLDGMLSFQGHPEFSKALSYDIMKHRRTTLGETVYAEGVRSLDQATDEQSVARWIDNFYTNNRN